LKFFEYIEEIPDKPWNFNFLSGAGFSGGFISELRPHFRSSQGAMNRVRTVTGTE
jgi:hypothetical protein